MNFSTLPWQLWSINRLIVFKLTWDKSSSELFWSPVIRRLLVCPSVCLYIFIFFSSTTGPISTKLGTKYPWVKGIQVYSNEGKRHSQRGDNWEITKINWQLLQNYWANFNQTWHKVSQGEGDSSLFNEGPCPFPKGDNYEIAKIHWRN